MNKAFKETLQQGLDSYGYDITAEQIDKLILFNTMVMQTNKHTNLTAIEDGASSARRHFLDSINPIANGIISKAKKVIDVGSGAGFPGIPLAILHPTISFDLLDTRKKRCEFMQDAISELSIPNANVLWARAESIGQNILHREKYDVACARALAAMPTLLEYLLPLIKVNGYAMLYKGPTPKDEISQATEAISILGGDYFTSKTYTIFGESNNYSMVYGKKIKPTPTKYPRKSGLPTKRPIM